MQCLIKKRKKKGKERKEKKTQCFTEYHGFSMISLRIYLFSQDSPPTWLVPIWSTALLSHCRSHKRLQEEEPIRPTSCDFLPHLSAASLESIPTPIPTPSLEDSIPQSSCHFPSWRKALLCLLFPKCLICANLGPFASSVNSSPFFHIPCTCLHLLSWCVKHGFHLKNVF